MEKVLCRSVAIAFVAASTFLCRAADNDPAVARYHFVGTSQLTGPNYDHVRKIFSQPSSVEYRNLVLDRFASKITRSIAPKGAAATVRPILDDLLSNESAGVFGQPGNGPESFVIAAHLSKDKQAAWVQNIKKLTDTSNALRIKQEGDWIIVARGDTLKGEEEKFLTDLRANHRPVSPLKDSILEANIDWPRLGAIPVVAQLPFKPAVLELKVSPKGNNLRTEIHARYPQPIAWKSQPWHLPTETIRDPLVSFSAGQNAAAFMKPSELAERIGENPFTNQFFLWANLSVPFETSALFPMKNAQRHVQSLGREFPSKFNAELEKREEGQFKWLEKTNQLVWQGLPIIVPYVKSVREKAGEFLLASTFVIAPGGPPAPAELWGQFKGRSDLVYYDWEISGPRLTQWRMLTPLLPIFPMTRTNDPSLYDPKNKDSRLPGAIVDRWLSGLISNLSPSKDNHANGNVVTEVTRKNAVEFTVVRSSQVGFTAIELMMLSHWLAGSHPSEIVGTPVRTNLPPHGLQKAK